MFVRGRARAIAAWILALLGAGLASVVSGQTITEFPIPTPGSFPVSITSGPDGALWFTENGVAANKIRRITTAASFLAASGVAKPQEAARQRVERAIGTLAVPFIDNQGQTDPRVAFYAPTLAGTVFVTREGKLVYSLPAACDKKQLSGNAGEAGQKPGGWTLTETFLDGKPGRARHCPG